MGDEIIELVPPTGPSLEDEAWAEWRKFEATLPVWFKEKINYTAESVWGLHQDKQGFYEKQFSVWHDKAYYRKDEKCWIEDRETTNGWLNTIRYGTLRIVLKLSDGDSVRLPYLYKNALDTMAKETFSAIAESQDKSVLQFLAEQIPVAGEIIGDGRDVKDLGDTLEKMVEIQEGLQKFEREYKSIQPSFNAAVVTVTRGYENGVLISGEGKTVNTVSKNRAEVRCEGEFWADLRDGEERVYRQEIVGWTGTWRTHWASKDGTLSGDMKVVLAQDGNSISGSYDSHPGEGNVNGSLTGAKLTGTWKRLGDPTKGEKSEVTGTFSWELHSRGTAFTGTYNNGTWSGSKPQD